MVDLRAYRPEGGVMDQRPEDAMNLTIRATNALRNGGILTLGALAQRTESDLLRLKNLGRISLAEIVDALREFGLSLGMSLHEVKQLNAPQWQPFETTESDDFYATMSVMTDPTRRWVVMVNGEEFANGKTRQEAVEEAVRVAEWIARELQAPPPAVLPLSGSTEAKTDGE